MNELDQRIRAILDRATPDTVFADTRALMALGYPAWSSFSLLEKVIIARAQQPRIVHAHLPLPPVQVTTLHDWKRLHIPLAKWTSKPVVWVDTKDEEEFVYW